MLALLDGRQLGADVKQAAELLATVVGQDLEQAEDGAFRIARRVAPDRVISTVDPEARHGHKTEARGYDGYKGHMAIDPDSEIIIAAEVTAANVGDGSVAKELLADVIAPAPSAESAPAESSAVEGTTPEPVEVYGDASYGSAEVLTHLEKAGAVANVKVQAATAPDGHFTKDAFQIQSREGHRDLSRGSPRPDPSSRGRVGAGELRHRMPDRARSRRHAPTPREAETSGWTSTSVCDSKRVHASAAPHGARTTGPRVPRLNASSHT